MLSKTALNKIPKINGLKQIANQYQNFFFDLDGVIWVGQQQIEGAIKCLQYLQSMKKNLFYITNNSTRNRQELEQKFMSFGFKPKLQNIYSSSYLAGIYLKQKHLQVKNVLVSGVPSLVKQIQDFGYEVQTLDHIDESLSFEELIPKYLQNNIDAVVIGYSETFSYKKMCLYSVYVQKGAIFLGTNPDKAIKRIGYKLPGAGCSILAIEASSGKKASIIGKPNCFAIERMIGKNSLKASQSIMIGDNLQTDIIFGKQAGLSTLCVLSGVSSQELVLNNDIVSPDYYSETI